MSIKPRKFTSRVGVLQTPPERTHEKGYILGSHIRRGLYEPVSQEITGLLRNTYDEPDSVHSDVDPLSSYAMDKFEKAILGRTNPETPTQKQPDDNPD